MPDRVACTSNTSNLESDEGGCWLQRQPGLCGDGSRSRALPALAPAPIWWLTTSKLQFQGIQFSLLAYEGIRHSCGAHTYISKQNTHKILNSSNNKLLKNSWLHHLNARTIGHYAWFLSSSFYILYFFKSLFAHSWTILKKDSVSTT